jgi:hypothetical protein
MIKLIIYISIFAFLACSRSGELVTEHPDHTINHHDSAHPVIQINNH